MGVPIVLGVCKPSAIWGTVIWPSPMGTAPSVWEVALRITIVWISVIWQWQVVELMVVLCRFLVLRAPPKKTIL